MRRPVLDQDQALVALDLRHQCTVTSFEGQSEHLKAYMDFSPSGLHVIILV